MLAAVEAGVGVQHAHVVEQLMGGYPHSIGIVGRQTRQDSHPRGQTREKARPYVGVSSIKGTSPAATGTLPKNRKKEGGLGDLAMWM